MQKKYFKKYEKKIYTSPMRTVEIGDMHIKQFNALFTKNILQNVIAQTAPLEFSGFKLYFESLEIHKPYSLEALKTMADKRLLPRDCREMNGTYGGACFLKLRFEYKNKVLFDDYKNGGIFPIMVKSQMCHLRECNDLYSVGEDPEECGGYFIVNGHERLVRFHIAYKRNTLFLVKSKSKDTAYSGYACMIRSIGSDEIGQKNEIRYCSDGNVHVKLFLRRRAYVIPAVLILRALVETTDEEIYESLGCDRRVVTMLGKMKDIECFSRRECLIHLGTRFKPVLKIRDSEECGREVLRRSLFVHLDRWEDKYNFLIEGIRKLLRGVDGEIVCDNIDSPANHELYTETQLIALAVKEKLEEIKRGLYIKILNTVRTQITTGDSTSSLNTSEVLEIGDEFDQEQVAKIMRSFTALDFGIGCKVSKFLSTGNITTYSCSDILQTTGFTILAERINFWRFVSHFQSVSRGAFFASLKITTIRKLRPESWGFFCPVHTPDGTPCGILLHLAKGCVAIDSGSGLDPGVFYEFGIVPVMRGVSPGVPLFFNGKLIGFSEKPHDFVAALRKYRSENGLCVEICHEFGRKKYDAIYVSDGLSSLMRRVRNLKTGRIDWIGIKEQVYLNIALSTYVTDDCFNDYDLLNIKEVRYKKNSIETTNNPDNYKDSYIEYEYQEIDNSDIFSSVAACIPYADYNPSPRNIYQCQMAKQAMGLPAYNIRSRTDNKTYWVNYLQKPVVMTSSQNALINYPIGFNCIVAVLSYTSYDMEDAVIINKSAKERGLFTGYIYKTEKYVLEKNSFIEYTPQLETSIKEGDVLVRYIDETKGVCFKRYSSSDEGVVDTVRIFENPLPSVTITIRVIRNPNIGDKFCSRHGQKGVLSMLWPEIDMPFTEQGLRPDIIINPHAFPSRMTIGMLLESMSGKAGVALGKEQDATPFVKKSFFNEKKPSGSIGEELISCGFNFYGNEPMYSGVTGTEFFTDIFIGCVYYQRLRHMVNDKFQVRTSGAVSATTNQPIGGRKNKGGIKFGEMERDALIGHGVSFLLKDRLKDCSDKAKMLLCESCDSVIFTNKFGCLCGEYKLKIVELPFVYKYLACELLAMNIKLKLKL